MFKRFFNFINNSDASKINVADDEMQHNATLSYTPNQATVTLSEDDINLFVADEIQCRLRGEELFDYDDCDPLLKESASLIFKHQMGSTSLIQRKLKLGYNRAGRIIDQLESIGLLGPFDGVKPRAILMSSQFEFDSLFNSGAKRASDKYKYFIQHILPSRLDYIDNMVDEGREKERQARVVDMKVQIREELLAKEHLKRQQDDLQKLKSQVLKEMIENGEISDALATLSREPIPQDVKDVVWNRDGGQCVNCGSNQKLEFDHIIPFAKGGSNTYRNIQLLCEPCNRAKSAKIG